MLNVSWYYVGTHRLPVAFQFCSALLVASFTVFNSIVLNYIYLFEFVNCLVIQLPQELIIALCGVLILRLAVTFPLMEFTHRALCAPVVPELVYFMNKGNYVTQLKIQPRIIYRNIINSYTD